MKNSQTLEQLAQACYAIRERVPTLPVLAIQWMHHTNTIDPVHEDILSKRKERWIFLLLIRIFSLILKSSQLFFRLIFLRWRLKSEIRLLKELRPIIVAKSWHFTHLRESAYSDFYYGALQQRLAEQDIELLLLSDNVSANGKGIFVAQKSKKGKPQWLPDFCLITPRCVLRVVCQQIASCCRLWLSLLKERDPLLGSVLVRGAIDSLKPQTMTNCLYYWVGKRAVQLWNPQAFLTLYEGYAWEKCLWAGIKSENPSCKIVGYQHTVILPRTLALRKPCLNPKEYSTPDIVLSSGYRTADILEKGHRLRKTKIIPFGSFRYSSVTDMCLPNPTCRTVLVTPDFHKEAPFLFNTAMKAAAILKDYHFIFRCHPIYSFNQISPYLESDLQKFPNIEISSRQKIEEDFARSSAIFYRGTSAVLYAILSGLKPFYLHREHVEVVDPIFELSDWREEVDSAEQLAHKILKYSQTPIETTITSWKLAAKYVQEYTIPVDEGSINRLLTAVGLKAQMEEWPENKRKYQAV